MPVYRYEALDDRGHKVAGVITAPDEPSARARVRDMGHFPTSLEPGSEQAPIRFGLSRAKVSDRDLAGVTRLLGTLLGAGFPVVDALGTLANQSSQTGMAEVLDDVRTRVQEGWPSSPPTSRSAPMSGTSSRRPSPTRPS
jgi:type II secretory pathway component PulF